jgi:two-component system sensor histidine kinase BaeS
VGSGLGLALVAALAERMGGRAVAGVAPEGGAAFTLLLPARPPSGRPGGGGDRTRTLLEHVPDTPAT